VNIQVHFAVKHSNECQVYRCSRCSTVFHSEMEWHLHVRVHHLGVARPFRCLFCREGFTTDSDLAAHVATHNKPFACPVCGESFLVEFLLDRHLETHHRCTADVVGPSAPSVAVTLPSLLASCLPLDAAASLLYGQVIVLFTLFSWPATMWGPAIVMVRVVRPSACHTRISSKLGEIDIWLLGNLSTVPPY